ncbi:MAG: hypothetical protein PUC39_10245 [Lachnospiraceae bacterium]|nr:hypothetical protein [Lachnospiraceae bacterium]
MSKLPADKEKNIYKEIIEFLLIAFLIPALCMWVRENNSNSIVDLIVYGIEAASPALAAVIVVILKSRKSLGKYLYEKYLLNFSLRKCILGIFIPFFILSLAKLISIWMGDNYLYPVVPNIRKIVIILWALIAEELGWRGFLQDKLERLLPDFFIPLLTGFMRCWTGFFMTTMITAKGSFLPVSILAILSSTLLGILYLPAMNQGIFQMVGAMKNNFEVSLVFLVLVACLEIFVNFIISICLSLPIKKISAYSLIKE